MDLEETDRQTDRQRPSFEYINIYLCTEVVTTRLRAGLAQAGDLTLHALTHTHTHRDNACEVEPLLGARACPLTEAARACGKTRKGGLAEEEAAALT